MKEHILKTIGGATAAVVILAVIAQVWASAPSNEGQNDQGLVGSWNLEVTLRDCESGTPFGTFPGMSTYNQGGTTQQTALPPPGSAPLPGHGAWSHTTGRNYSGAFQFFALNANPALNARVIVRSNISLDRGGDSYTSTDTAEIFALDGTLVDRSCSTTTATRFK